MRPKVIRGHYRNLAGFLYWIKAVWDEKRGKYAVYKRQYSPALQSGWSFIGYYDEEEVRDMCFHVEVEDTV